MSSDGVSLGEARILHRKEKAMLVELIDVGEERWIPLSLVHDDSECYVDEHGAHDGDLVVMAWWADQEGLT